MQWVERWTCDQQVVGSIQILLGAKLRNDLGQVVYTYVLLSPCGITWYRPRDSDALQAWRKVMAAYRWAGWLPVHQDQIRSKHSVTSIGSLYFFRLIHVLHDIGVESLITVQVIGWENVSKMTNFYVCQMGCKTWIFLQPVQSFHFVVGGNANSCIWLFASNLSVNMVTCLSCVESYCKNVCLVTDASGNMDGKLLGDGNSFDEVLFDLADQLSDTGTGKFLTQWTFPLDLPHLCVHRYFFIFTDNGEF